MTTLDSSSASESRMDESGHSHRRSIQPPAKANSINTAATTVTTANNSGQSPSGGGFRSNGFGEQEGDDNAENFSQEGDAEVWGAFTDNFRQVQSFLDRNRMLIQQVNDNHQSKIHDSMVKNVALIQEINGNVSKVVSLYSNLSANFSSMFHQQGGAVDEKSNNGEGDTAQA